MLQVSIHVAQRDNILHTASGTAVVKNGSESATFKFRSGAVSFVLGGEAYGRSSNLYVDVAHAAIQRFSAEQLALAHARLEKTSADAAATIQEFQ